MNVSLSPPSERLLSHMIRKGYYRSADEALFAALTLLTDQIETANSIIASSRESIVDLLRESIAQADRGETFTSEQVWESIEELKRHRTREPM